MAGQLVTPTAVTARLAAPSRPPLRGGMASIGVAAILWGTCFATGTAFAQDQSKAGPGDQQAEAIRRILEGTGGASDPLTGVAAPVVEERKSDPEAIAIVNQYLKAIGGREVLAAIEDRTTKFHNIKFSATGETQALIALYLKEGYMYREEWEIKGFKIGEHPLAFVQIYNGDLNEGWVKMFHTVSDLDGRTLSVFVWDKYLDDFFLHWEEDGYTLHIAGQGLVDDEPADIVRVADFSGRQSVRYYFSRATGLLVKKDWVDTTSAESGKKEQYFRKYRSIKFSDNSDRSILFPLQVDIMVDGDLDTERVYTEVRFNSSLNDALFAKPEGVPFEQRHLGQDGSPQPDVDLPVAPKTEGSGSRLAPIRRAHGAAAGSTTTTSSDGTAK